MSVEHPVSVDQSLRAFLEGTAAATGEAFFRATVRHLAQALDVSHAFIAQCSNEDRTRLRILALWSVDDYGANFEYGVAGTPCAAVMRDETAYFADGVQASFPTDIALCDMGARSYLAVPVHDTAGAVVGHLGVLDRRPMTKDRDHWILHVFAARAGAEFARLEADQRLRESETRARTLLDRYFDGITLAVDGSIVYANPALCALAGYASAEDMVGRPPSDFIAPEQRDRVTASMLEVLAGGPEAPQEYQGIRQDGSNLPVEVLGRRITFKGRPAILAAVRDLTARKHAEGARHQAEAELSRVLDAIPDLIWSGDITAAGIMRYRWASPGLERLTGRPPAFFQGKQLRWLTIVDPVDRPHVKELADRLISGESDHNDHEYRIVRPDGTIRWVRDSAVVTEGIGGQRLIQGIVSDITERKMLAEQLFHAQKLESVGQLAAGVAHNFNNALTAISGYSELLARRFPKDDPASASLEQIQRATDQAVHLTRQLLTFSRRAPFEPTELCLNEVVDTTQDLLSSLLGETIRIDLVLDRSVPTVRCDRAQMEQALADLVLNARDAMPDGGTITIETDAVRLDDAVRKSNADTRLGLYARLRVTDTGTGMDANTVARVFEPFFTTKEPGKGVGLGLAMVHGMVTQARGFVTVTSTQGRGTTFNLFLPV